METYLGLSIISVLSAYACTFLAQQRGGSSVAWFILGLLFGQFAFLVALTAGKKCRKCYSVIPSDATTCRYCNNEAR